MPDVLLFQTNDDGDILIKNGEVTTTGGLETAVYLSLFGGNARDDGARDNALQWWGNADETDESAHMRSRTQYILDGALSSSSANLKRVIDAAYSDLAWLDVDELTVEAQLLSHTRIAIRVVILDQTFSFTEDWTA